MMIRRWSNQSIYIYIYRERDIKKMYICYIFTIRAASFRGCSSSGSSSSSSCSSNMLGAGALGGDSPPEERCSARATLFRGCLVPGRLWVLE